MQRFTQHILGVPSRNCLLLGTVVAACSSVAYSCTTLLFFLRLRAIYNRNRIIVSTFFALWLAFPALSIYLPYVINMQTDLTLLQNLEATTYCPIQVFYAQKLVFYTQLATLTYDTLVFIAISWRLCRISVVKPRGPQESLKLVFFGKYLPTFTKSIYRDGQVYYL